jgi:hypothetical protein
VFASNPHTHLIGKRVYTKIIRNGKEIGYLQKTMNYDFDYQFTSFFVNPVTLYPGDELKTTCIYDSSQRTNYTFVRIFLLSLFYRFNNEDSIFKC